MFDVCKKSVQQLQMMNFVTTTSDDDEMGVVLVYLWLCISCASSKHPVAHATGNRCGGEQFGHYTNIVGCWGSSKGPLERRHTRHRIAFGLLDYADIHDRTVGAQ
jgi:hypothetical protein